MARPQVTNGGDGLQIQSVAANIMNQSRTANKGRSFRFGNEPRAYSPLPYGVLCYKTYAKALKFKGFFGRAKELVYWLGFM
jgi:hypothetical protein